MDWIIPLIVYGVLFIALVFIMQFVTKYAKGQGVDTESYGFAFLMIIPPVIMVLLSIPILNWINTLL